MQRITRDHDEQLHATKFNNTEEIKNSDTQALTNAAA